MKARKQGNALVLSIPAKLDVKEGTDYMVMKEADGSLIFTPKEPNIFTSRLIKKDDLRPENDDLLGSRIGREDI
ncbi:type II toxin-antitoxin system PemI/MazE family antitoxin [Levilactobacillus andaensis]|uniref:type II toxin-antitoxin system PemI/MazE family antitoxin n=1 Tax=Levilactobacillus andaensis TaxID=2799570 RepID=UPI001940C071|nr:AbrB family transcriptional regulator [Levilactobacillus andaensis]